MSVEQFESFQVSKLIEWANGEVYPGYRYQFKSPSSKNSAKLYSALLTNAKDFIECDDVSLPVIPLKHCLLLPVLHKSNGAIEGFTENYISKLRDDVAGQIGSFKKTALVIIHNSFLDTLVNSAQDLGSEDRVWSVASIHDSLKELIDQQHQGSDVSTCLLDYQCDMIQSENATMFGFEPLYDALDDGELEFGELGLFNDPLVLKMEGSKAQIRNRLEANRILYEKIASEVEHFPNQLSSRLKQHDLGAIFRTQIIKDPSGWSKIDYEDYKKEIERNKKHGIEFKEVSLTGGELYERPKNSKKTGLRERHVVIVPNEGQTEFELKVAFEGDVVRTEEVKRQGNNIITRDGKIVSRTQSSGVSRVTLNAEFPEGVSYFALNLKRDKTSECYKIRCVVLPSGIIDVDTIKDVYLVDVGRKRLVLKTDKFVLPVRSASQDTCTLRQNNEEVDVTTYSAVDFGTLWNEVDPVEFSLKAPNGTVDFCIKGTPADNSLELPLVFSQQRFGKLFKDDYNATVLNEKDKYSLDNCEFKVVGLRAKLLSVESAMLKEEKVAFEESNFLTLKELKQVDSEIYTAYSNLFRYLRQKNTLPSLVSWGIEYRALIADLVGAVSSFLRMIEEGTMLSESQKKVLRIGVVVIDGETYYSSYHPIVLSYYWELFHKVCADASFSFKELQKVTLDRLSPSGLLPYVFHPKSQYAFVSSLPENAFWLKIVPQQDASHSFVRKLVADKLTEFQNAYCSLFRKNNAPLLINAVNLHSANELFWGLVRFIKAKKGRCNPMHVNFYDDELSINIFDRFNDIEGAAQLQEFLESGEKVSKELSAVVIDTLRKRVTHSKFTHKQAKDGQLYSHVTFFKNNKKAEVKPTIIEKNISGVACDGLLCGEASECKEDSYFTAFGLRNIDCTDSAALTLARYYGLLIKPALGSNEQYSNSSAIALAVDGNFRDSLTKSYDSSIWTTIIDPKVTLNFFRAEKDLTLIHYSDQYTSSTNYDAITVTKQIGLFSNVLKAEHGGEISEFNAFNGTWLLGMLTASPKIRKERVGIIGAYKFVTGMLAKSDITWVPISVAEMIRVSGNIGLKISESDLAKPLHAGKSGAISDDILFVGFKDDHMYLLPVEVKTGAPPNYAKAVTQARALLSYLGDTILGRDCLAHKLYRSLFVRQVLIQIDNYELYGIFEKDYFKTVVERREEWLRGDYNLSKVQDYVEGIVVAHSDSEACLSPGYDVENNVLKITLPSALLGNLVQSTLAGKQARVDLIAPFKVPSQYILKDTCFKCLREYLLEKQAVEKAITEGSSVETKIKITNVIDSKKQNVTSVEVGLGKEIEGSCVTSRNLKVLFGHDEMTLEPIFWEPTNTSKFLNTNTGIIGTMGTGKTQFTKSLVTQLIQNQAQNVDSQPVGMLIFDYKSDYADEEFVSATGATVLKPRMLPYNPLSLHGDAPPVLVAEGFVDTMTRVFGLGVKQRTKLHKLIMEAYSRAGILGRSDKPAPTVADIYELFLEEDPVEDSLYAALYRLCTFEVFEKDTSKVCPLYDMLDGVVVLKLDKCPSQFQSLVVALTLDLFYIQMQNAGKPKIEGDFRQITKMVLVDEADNFMSQDFPALRKILKEGREYGVGTILSTQDITHFKTKENEYANYMETWVVHRVAKIEGQHTKLIFNLSEKNDQKSLAAQIGKLEKHQSIFAGGDKKLQKMQDKAFWQLMKEAS